MNGGVHLPSLSTGCPSLPKAPTGSRRTPSPPASRPRTWNTWSARRAGQPEHAARAGAAGITRSEDFYDLCDRYGILVWQDFMFSCSIYPFDDPQFVENVHQEIVHNVNRLRHRACLALWCGNNEMEVGLDALGLGHAANAILKEADKTFFYKTLPAWVREQDPDRAYWPSSPSSGLPHEVADSPATGDRHLWEVWHANKPSISTGNSSPVLPANSGFNPCRTCRRWLLTPTPDEWNMTSLHHGTPPAQPGRQQQDH